MDDIVAGPPATTQPGPTTETTSPRRSVVPHIHPASPRATAIRGTRRQAPDLRRLIPKALEQHLAVDAIAAGRVDPCSALVLWNVAERAVDQPVHNFTIPDDIDLRPARRIGTYLGARSRMGHLVTIRDGMALMLEVDSREEHGWGRAMRMEPGVTWLHTQPFVLVWPDVDGGSIFHVPDILAVRYGRPVVVDVRPAELITHYDEVIFDLTARTLDVGGVEYRVHGDLSLQAKANLISIRRHRNINPRFDYLVRLVREQRPATAHHALTLCGTPSIGRTVLFHLVANAVCRIPLDEPIHRSTRIEWVIEPS